MKLKILTDHFKKFQNQNYTLTKIITIWEDIKYRKLLLTKKAIFENKLTESID